MLKYYEIVLIIYYIYKYSIGYLGGGLILVENGKVKVHVVKPR